MSLLNNFPSYDAVIKGAARTFARYPFALLSATFATMVTVVLVEVPAPENNELLERLQLASALGIALFVALVHFAEKMRWPKQANLALQFGGLVLLLVYYLTLPADVFGAYIDIVRFLLLAIGLHFLVAVLPYIADKQVQGFWQYNKSLFLRFLIAALYSGVLYVGLTIALAAADHLFNMDVPPERYFQMWLITVGMFNTWVFLAGVPEDLHRLSDDYAYPKGLKIFTQYILLSLVALYFVILIAYEAKIIIEWNWPKGWVSHLVLWYSVVGILSALLLHPLRELSGNRWIQAFTTWFYRLLIPLVVLLFLAIMRRISEYGITENRYFVLVMAIGLSIAVLYFVVSRRKDIRIIPGILCLLAFVAAYGPWSAFSVSENCQRDRLESFLTRHEILVDGAIQKASAPVPFADRQQMSSIVTYLSEWHGLEPFREWFSENVLASLDTLELGSRDNELTMLMGFEWVSEWATPAQDGRFSWQRPPGSPVYVGKYDYMLPISVTPAAVIPDSFIVSDISGRIVFDSELLILTIRLGESDDNIVAVQLKEVLVYRDSLNDPDWDAAERMWLAGQSVGLDAMVIIRSVSGNGAADSLRIKSLTADLLLRVDSR